MDATSNDGKNGEQRKKRGPGERKTMIDRPGEHKTMIDRPVEQKTMIDRPGRTQDND